MLRFVHIGPLITEPICYAYLLISQSLTYQ
jgi:hypothetical protein